LHAAFWLYSAELSDTNFPIQTDVAQIAPHTGTNRQEKDAIMDELGKDQLAATVRRLERENRAIKRTLLGIVLFGTVGTFAAATMQQGDFLRTQRLIIEDNQGNQRFVFDGGSEGRAAQCLIYNVLGNLSAGITGKGVIWFPAPAGGDGTMTAVSAGGITISNNAGIRAQLP
jgi:hypothetical protein